MASHAKAPFCVVALVLFAATAQAQPVVETCGAGDTLGPVTLPWTSSPAFNPASQDFTIAGCSAVNGQDVVICFKPTTTCTVDLTCNRTGSGNVVIILTSGACATTTSCVVSTASSGPTATLGAGLTGGTRYCAVCSTSDASASFTIGIAAQPGFNCGAMPVSLQSFTAE